MHRMKRILLSALFAVFIITTVAQAQECDFYLESTGCVGQPVNFYPDCTASTYSWYINNQYVGSNNTQNGEWTFAYTFTAPGSYSVKMVFAVEDEPGGGMTTTDVIHPITIYATPITPVLSASRSEVCDADASVTVTHTNPAGATYTWSAIPVTSGVSGSGTSKTVSLTQATQFIVTASNGNCASEGSATVNVAKTTVQPTLGASSYRLAQVNTGTAYQHYWQTSATGTDIVGHATTGGFAVTESGTYYIRRYSDLGNCWANASAPLTVSVNLTPPKPVVNQYYHPGYTTADVINDDETYILQFAKYYWVRGANLDEIVSECVNGKTNFYKPGTYYLRGRDVATGTWGTPETVVITLRPEDDLNWVQTKAFAGDPSGTVIAESKSYFDDAGKPLQSQVKVLAAGKVLATESLRDRYDRVVGSTLPAPLAIDSFGYNGAFMINEAGEKYTHPDFDGTVTTENPLPVNTTTEGTLGWYYGDNNPDATVARTQYPYSRTYFYEDGTGEVKKSIGVGNVFRERPGHETMGGSFPVFNVLNDYLSRRTTALGDVGGDGNLFREGVQSVSRDENGKYVVSVTDKAGKTVMTARIGTSTDSVLRVYDKVIASADPTSVNYQPVVYFYILNDDAVTITGSTEFVVEDIVTNVAKDKGATFANAQGIWPAGFYRARILSGDITLRYTNYYLDVSYQYYDDAGRLRASISPNGFKALKSGVAYSDIDKTTYEYNHRGWLLRMTEKDAGMTEYKYRKDGKIRFSQNAQQRDNGTAAGKGKFSYTNYDALGRPIESGEYIGTAYAFDATLNSQLELSTQVTYPSADVKDWVRTHYDEPASDFVTVTGLASEDYPQEFIRGAVSWTENENIKTYYSYDELGRVTWMAQKPAGLSRTFVTRYAYDFLGNVLTVANATYNQGAIESQFYHHYEYDADKKLSNVYTSLDGTTKKLRAHYEYYLHGPLKRIELGGGIQGIDFVYNIHGWLTQINHPNTLFDPGQDGGVDSDFRKDAFGMILEYYDEQPDPVAVVDPLQIHNLPGTASPSLVPSLAFGSNHAQLKDQLKQATALLQEQQRVPSDNMRISGAPLLADANSNSSEDLIIDNPVYSPQDASIDPSEPLPNFIYLPTSVTASVTPLPLPEVFDEGLVPDAIEFAALKDLYDSLAGSGWTNKSGWPAAGSWPSSATATEMDAWLGIVVTGGDITEINLSSNNLTGKIPASIGNLAKLKNLYLLTNKLSGRIPTTIGSLSSLENLSLYNNQLTGAIPASLGNITTLKQLMLFNNQLTGAIPSELGNLPNLWILRLYTNQLSGSLPASLGNVISLGYLEVQQNLLTGSIPASYSNLTNLIKIDLSNNQLTGSLPDVSGWTKLTSMEIGYSQLSGSLPAALGTLTNLTNLRIYNSNFSGSLPNLGNLTKLQFLYLYGLPNLTAGPIPDWVGNLTNVTDLLMISSNRTGELPSSMQNMKKLQSLQLSGNQLSGEIPHWIGELSELNTLYLHQNQFTGSIPPTIGNCTKLTRLYLRLNQLSGSIPSTLGNLTLLSELHLSDNQLSGSVPASFGNLVNLTTLFLQNNRLSGAIPNISGLTKLEKLDGTNNQFDGISTSVLGLTKLTQLTFNYNRLVTVPNVAQAVNKANLTVELQYNYLDFTDLEPIFATMPHGIKSIKYAPQYAVNLNSVSTVPVPQGSNLVLQAAPKGNYSTVTWERQTGPTTWINVTSLNEDATGQTFKLSNATTAIDGYVYRWKMTNTKVASLTITSDPLTIQVTEPYMTNGSESDNTLYNGLITAQRWRTDKAYQATDTDLTGMYRYQYDDKYQIKDATWAIHNGITYTLQGNQYRVTNLTYDPNGNIQTMNRYDQNGTRTNQFTYTYAANTNQLQRVTGYANAYTYNSIGQMISVDKADKTNETAATGNGDQTVEYDVTGKVTKVYGQSASQIGYYKMDGSGANSWGPMDAGTVNGAVLTDDHSGKANSAYLFDGIDDSIIIPDAADKTSFKATDFTVAVRVKKLVSINGSAHEALIGKWNHASNPGTNEWLLAIGNNGNVNTAAMSIETGTTRYQAVGTTVLQPGNWYHVVGQREGDRLKIYVNGQLEGSVNIGIVSINNTSSQLFVARMLGGFMTNCAIADIQIFNRALKDNEIKALNQDKASELLVSNLYDDRGFRLAKVNHTTSKTTWYIRDASGNVVNTSEQDGLPAFANTPVTWRTLIHTANTNGTLSLVDNATDAMAVSEQQLSPGNDGELTYVISDLNNKKNIGLRDARNANYKYYFDFYADLSTIAIRKYAQLQASFNYAVGDVVKIIRQGEYLLFYHNGILKFTLPVASSVTLEAFVELGEATSTVSGLMLSQTGNKPVVMTEIPIYGSGKLGTYYPQQDGSVAYEITDHLGNVRALVRDNVTIYTATMEDNGNADTSNPRVKEMQYFTNLFETEVNDYRMNHTAPIAGVVDNPSRAAYLYWINGQPAGKSVGPALSLQVSKGDTVRMETWVRYENQTTYNRNLTTTLLAQALGTSFAYQGVFEASTLSQTTTALQGALGGPFFAGNGSDNTRPYAYLNYILFDNNMVMRDAGWQRVPVEAGFDPGHEADPTKKPVRLAFNAPKVIGENGYLYVWVSNESEATKVWFDDLSITHSQAVNVQATDYGVWGDVLREQKSTSLTYRYGYQGQYAEKDAETGWSHFELREYDPVIGRWTSADPKRQYYSPYIGIGNNPTNSLDKDGGFKVPIHESITYYAAGYRGLDINSKNFIELIRGVKDSDYLGFALDLHFDNRKNFIDIIGNWALINDRMTLASNTNGSAGYRLMGTVLHTVQDFYAHSNFAVLYVGWYAEENGSKLPVQLPTFDEALQIDGFRDVMMSKLKTGKFDLIQWAIKEKLLGKFSGPDSHQAMNLDDAKGYLGKLARAAAEEHSIDMLGEFEELHKGN